MKQINSLNLPEDEKAFLDLNSAFSSRGLVDESIRLLEARVAAGSRNPGIYRALGDRFLAAGLTKQATEQYEVASTLAKGSENPGELSKAQKGLRQAVLLEQEIAPGEL